MSSGSQQVGHRQEAVGSQTTVSMVAWRLEILEGMPASALCVTHQQTLS